jgi:hypothetical protein
MVEFDPFQKIPRLSRDIVVTEKIDGTNASIYIGEDGTFLTGSRTRWITPADDNFGFSRWAYANREFLMLLGPGHHFGEWWGSGIQRGYAQPTKRFSLFNVKRWEGAEDRPPCCDVVPVLYSGPLECGGVMSGVTEALQTLRIKGSIAAPGFMKPEGIIVWHTAGRGLFKKTLEKDEKHKGEE